MVMKVSAADSSVLYSTALSGAVPNAIAMDADGNAVIAGTASSLAVTKGAYQSTIPGPCARSRLIRLTPSRPRRARTLSWLNSTRAARW
jgi:hypothetical protein